MSIVIEHALQHHYQPTNHSCGQASLAMLLSSLGRSDTPEELVQSIPTLRSGASDWGTLAPSLAPSLATWLLRQGLAVDMYTADFQLIDLEWAALDVEPMLERMRLALQHRAVPSLGGDLSKAFLRTYIEFVEEGGSLEIRPHMSSDLLDELLFDGPVFINVQPNVLFGYGRTRDGGLRRAISDDLQGSMNTHFVVLYGRDGEGRYLIADPWREPGRHVIEVERLLCAMTAGQIQCENTIFRARTKPVD